MIIQYDKNPNFNTDQKLQSLIESIHLALNEFAEKKELSSYLKLSGGKMEGPFEELITTSRSSAQANESDTGIIVRRNDTGTTFRLVINPDGITHGIWSDTLNKWLIVADANDSILVNGAKMETWSPSISITTNTGQLVSANARQYGKVVQLYLTFRNPDAVAGGQNIFTGTLNTTGLRPAMNLFGASYYGNRSIVGFLNTAGSITIRNASSSPVTISSDTVGMTFTYLIP